MLDRRRFFTGLGACLGAASLLPFTARKASATPIVGPSVTYTDAQLGMVVPRSNAGQPMFDLLPGNPALSDGFLTVYNDDALASLVINTGTILDGASTNFLMLGPKQAALIYIEDGEYRAVSKPLLTLLGQATTFHVNNITGNDLNCGLTPATAFRTLQAAWNFASRRLHLNHKPAEFLLANTGVEYTPGVVAYDLLTGQAADYGVVFRGEEDPVLGVVVQVADGGPGCFHCAGTGQMYVRSVRARGFNNARCFTAPYYGFMGLDKVMCMGTESTLIEVGAPGSYGRIEFGSIWMIVAPPNGEMGSGALVASGKGVIHVKPLAQCIIVGNPHFSSAFATAVNGGQIVALNQWSGAARGVKWLRKTGGEFITGYADQALDNYLPGDLPGVAQDGTGFNR